jgi:hypothetical protein
MCPLFCIFWLLLGFGSGILGLSEYGFWLFSYACGGPCGLIGGLLFFSLVLGMLTTVFLFSGIWSLSST